MADRVAIPDMRAFQEEVHHALKRLTAVAAEEQTDVVPSEARMVARVADLALVASAAGLGECRQATPFAALYPLIDSSGTFMWCCTHEPAHCSQ
jgi:hypothetical protein